MVQIKSIRRGAPLAPAPDTVRRFFVAEPRAARVAFSYFLRGHSEVPYADWDIAASSNPDDCVRLEVSRTYRRDLRPALSLTTEISRDELRAFGRALLLIAERLGEETDAESWQEVRA